MNKALVSILLLLLSQSLWAGYTNYKSILIGNTAAGMGGAFTALTGDPAGSSYYNPATIARMPGVTLSAAVSVYNKYDTTYGNEGGFGSAALRVNQGNFVPLASSSGSVYTFKNFAVGISILSPDYDAYQGEVLNTSTKTTTVNLIDESLWVGGTIAYNTTNRSALGLSIYYTSRNYVRSYTDRATTGADTTLITEEKDFSTNSLVYILGYYYELSPQWNLGLSHRFPSLQINGRGSFISSNVSTTGPPATFDDQLSTAANTRIPSKTTLGFAFKERAGLIYSVDIDYYYPESYIDLPDTTGATAYKHQPIWNFSIGMEKFIRSWLAWRVGLFTNYSSTPEISSAPTARRADHIDMLGFSSNFGIYTSKNSSVTLGGYYTGGKGHGVEVINQQLQKVDKNVQIFTFLVSTAYEF